VFEAPLARGAERGACPAERALAAARRAELDERIARGVLRRTRAEIDRAEEEAAGAATTKEVGGGGGAAAAAVARRPPPQTTYVCFHRLAPGAQTEAYRGVVRTGNSSGALEAVGALRRACLAAELVAPGGVATATAAAAEPGPCRPGAAPPPSPSPASSAPSAKLEMVRSFLRWLLVSTTERCVVASTSTAMLDLVESEVLRPLAAEAPAAAAPGSALAPLAWSRLDGRTPPDRRAAAVAPFSRPGGPGQGAGGTSTSSAPRPRQRVLLLSARAGGAGLNLVGCSRLLLLDPDWNPAVDAQVLARLRRPGQRLRTFAYRLAAVGSVEERVLMRQGRKRELGGAGGAKGGAGTVGGGAGAGGGQFTREELRALFSYDAGRWGWPDAAAATTASETDRAAPRRGARPVDAGCLLRDTAIEAAGGRLAGATGAAAAAWGEYGTWADARDDCVPGGAGDDGGGLAALGAALGGGVVTWVQRVSVNGEEGAESTAAAAAAAAAANADEATAAAAANADEAAPRAPSSPPAASPAGDAMVEDGSGQTD